MVKMKDHHPCDGLVDKCTPIARAVLPFTLIIVGFVLCADAAIRTVFRYVPYTRKVV